MARWKVLSLRENITKNHKSENCETLAFFQKSA